MEQEKRNPIFSIDLTIRFRSAVYQIDVAKILKWVGVLVVVGIRLYRQLRLSDSS